MSDNTYDAESAAALLDAIDQMDEGMTDIIDPSEEVTGECADPDEMEIEGAPAEKALQHDDLEALKKSPSLKGEGEALDAAPAPAARTIDPNAMVVDDDDYDDDSPDESLGESVDYVTLFPDLDDIERAQKRFEAKCLVIRPIAKTELGVFATLDVVIEKTDENREWKADSGVPRPQLLIKKQIKFNEKYDEEKDKVVYDFNKGDLLGEVQMMGKIGKLREIYRADRHKYERLYPTKYIMAYRDIHSLTDPETFDHRVLWFTAPHVRGPTMGKLLDLCLVDKPNDPTAFPRHLIAPIITQIIEAVLFMHTPSPDKPFIQWHGDLHHQNIMLDLDAKVPYESPAGVYGAPCVMIVDLGGSECMDIDQADLLQNAKFTSKQWLEFMQPKDEAKNPLATMQPYWRTVGDIEHIRTILIRMIFSRAHLNAGPILDKLTYENIGAESKSVQATGLDFDGWEPVDRALREHRLDEALGFARQWLKDEKHEVSQELIKDTDKLLLRATAKQVTDDDIEERISEWVE